MGNMGKLEKLYRCYLMEKQELNAKKQLTPELTAFYGFLRFRLNPDDFIEAEGLLNDLLAVIEEDYFITGIEYLSEFIKEILTE